MKTKLLKQLRKKSWEKYEIRNWSDVVVNPENVVS